MDKRILRENDIRGKYPDALNEETIYDIGRALGTYIRKKGEKECLVGRDNRLSGRSLTNSFIDGLNFTGVNVIYLGITTTPMLNYACVYLHKKFGVEITASHNPKEENGIKMFEDNLHLIGNNLKSIYNILLNKEFLTDEKGIIELYSINDIYAKMIINSVTILNKNLKVVVDAGNGTAAVIQKAIFDNLGIEPIYINEVSDGNFPNHHPDPSIEANLEELKQTVIANQADLGIAFDGDADRLGMVDEKGNYIASDIFPIIFMKDIIENSKYNKFLIDIKCSKLLREEIERLGGEAIIVKNGSAYIEDELKYRNIICGAEYSGHIFFRDRFYGFDDGIYAGLRFLEIMAKNSQKCSEFFKDLPKYYNTEEIRVSSPDEIKFTVIEKIKKYCEEKNYPYNTIDGVKVEFPDRWALIRCSNTGPTITMRFEANTEKQLEEIKKEFTSLVEKLNK